jgi:hypothetical protein
MGLHYSLFSLARPISIKGITHILDRNITTCQILKIMS